MVRDTPMHAVRPMCSCKAARPGTDPPKPWIDLFPRDHDNPTRILSRIAATLSQLPFITLLNIWRVSP